MFKFECRIHKKPRGNWRPRVDISIAISAENYPHRPRLKGIRLIFKCDRCSSCNNRRLIVLNHESDILLPEDAILYDRPERGSGNLVGSYRCNDNEKYGYLEIVSSKYISDDYNLSKTFYLPWRPGAKPDYSDFAEAFSQIPLLLAKQLEDGLDSGESDAIIITESSVMQQKLEEDIKRKEKPSRKLKIA